MCYNITYKSPPMVMMTAGGLEPPRQLPASRTQIYCACQLHHAVAESGEDELAKDFSSPPSPQLKGYYNLAILSRLYTQYTLVKTHEVYYNGYMS